MKYCESLFSVISWEGVRDLVRTGGIAKIWIDDFKWSIIITDPYSKTTTETEKWKIIIIIMEKGGKCPMEWYYPTNWPFFVGELLLRKIIVIFTRKLCKQFFMEW